jgi:hypothetical protein
MLGTDRYGYTRRLNSNQHPGLWPIFLSQEADAMKPDPVENFGAHETTISMHASTSNTI